MSRRAAALSRRGCTRRSRISPSLSTARHRYMRRRDHHLVQVPGVRRPWSQPSQVARKSRSELEDPPPDRLVGNLEAALRQEFLDVAVGQGEPQIEPNRVPDDLRREAMTIVGDALHPLTLPANATTRS